MSLSSSRCIFKKCFKCVSTAELSAAKSTSLPYLSKDARSPPGAVIRHINYMSNTQHTTHNTQHTTQLLNINYCFCGIPVDRQRISIYMKLQSKSTLISSHLIHVPVSGFIARRMKNVVTG